MSVDDQPGIELAQVSVTLIRFFSHYLFIDILVFLCEYTCMSVHVICLIGCFF